MWTKFDIMKLRLRLGMSTFQFAKKLGVSMPDVENWELGLPVDPINQAKLDNLDRGAQSYLAQKLKLGEAIQKHELEKQKSEYVTAYLPNMRGSASYKR